MNSKLVKKFNTILVDFANESDDEGNECNILVVASVLILRLLLIPASICKALVIFIVFLIFLVKSLPKSLIIIMRLFISFKTLGI